MSTVSTGPAQDSSGEAVYRTSRGHRTLSALSAAIMLLVYGLELTDGNPSGPWSDLPEPWWGLLAEVVLLGMVLLPAVDGFLARIEISDRTLWKRRPLWTDKAFSLGKTERVHFPTIESGLWLYTDPDGDPALTIGGQFERFGRLAVEVKNPALPGGASIAFS